MIHSVQVPREDLGKIRFSHFSPQVESRFPVGRAHLMVIPKITTADLRKCKRHPHQTLLKTMLQLGKEQLAERYNVKSKFLAGFSYPSEYNQLCLHVVAPPITNFLLFRKATWYPYKQAQADLFQYGYVQKKEGIQATDIDPGVVALDKKVRELRAKEKEQCEEWEAKHGVNPGGIAVPEKPKIVVSMAG